MTRAHYALILASGACLTVACGPRDHGEGDAGVCVDTVLCIRGTHWSTDACACVPDSVGTGGSTSTCVQTELCVRGDHWDSTLCRCVVGPQAYARATDELAPIVNTIISGCAGIASATCGQVRFTSRLAAGCRVFSD
jgi:hypothetical protein